MGSGFKNDTMLAQNVNFTNVLPGNPTMTTDGQLIIAHTALNAGGTHIDIGVLTSPLGTIQIGYNNPNITLDITGGSSAIEKVILQTGTSPIIPSGGQITFNGAVVAAGTNPVRTDGTGLHTMALEVQISQTNPTTDVNRIGLCSFDSNAFSVDPNGFVKTGINRYPITPYVVGPVGFAGYQTIQSALDAANAAGSGAVWVMPGSYTENLTLYPSSQIVGAVSNSDVPLGSTVLITGIHTPPATGYVSFNNLFLVSATDVFSSAVAGSTILIVENCITGVTNGFTYNLPNWTGTLALFNCQQADTNNGIVNNTGGATTFFEVCNIGQGTGKTMITTGFVHMNNVDLMCPWNCTTGTILDIDSVTFSHSLTLSNNTTGTIRNCSFITGSDPAITMSSSGTISLLKAIVDTSNNPAIAGAGAGVLTYEDIVFTNNAAFALTLTLATTSWQPYSRAIGSTDGTKVGTCAFDNTNFAVDPNGFVTLVGGGFKWNDVSGAFSPLKNNGYFITGTATGTLPASPAQGDTIQFFVDHASQLLTIQASGTQIIRMGSLVSSAGGTWVSTLQGDSCELVYRASDTCWCAVDFVGTWTKT